ncbi:hypothetical protein D3C72_1597260 [compost metagenome]
MAARTLAASPPASISSAARSKAADSRRARASSDTSPRPMPARASPWRSEFAEVASSIDIISARPSTAGPSISSSRVRPGTVIAFR